MGLNCTLMKQWPEQQEQTIVGMAQELLTLLFGDEHATEILDLIGVVMVQT